MINPRDEQRTPPSSVDCRHRLPARSGDSRALRWVLLLTAAFMVVELVGGLVANSLALLADAGHMLTDVGALGLALFAAWFSRRPATPDKTYGYLRIEILAAMVNGVALFVVAGLILWDAVGRIAEPEAVDPVILMSVAAGGLVVNIIGARMLHRGHRHSLNLRGAYLHVLGDLLGSIGAILAGGIILATGWTLADPVISVVIAFLILVGAWRLVRESTDVLLEATPSYIALGEVADGIASVSGVESVHDLHVWTLAGGVVAMSGHAVVPDPERSQGVLEEVQDRMGELGIAHVTLQIERKRSCASDMPL